MELPQESRTPQVVSFDLADLFASLWQKKFRIVFTAAALIGIGFYYINAMPKRYMADAILMMGSSQPMLALPTSVSSLAGGDSKLDTYIEFMRSKQFAELIVEEMQLYKKTEFLPKEVSRVDYSPIEFAANLLLKNLSIRKLSNTEMLKLTYESLDPETAAEVVNFMGPAFFKFYTERDQQKADNKSQWLNSQLSELQQTLADSENYLQQFLQDNQLIDIASQIELAKTEIGALLQQKLQVDRALSEAQVTLQQVRKAGDDPLLRSRIPALQSNPMFREIEGRLVQQQQIMAEVSKRYKYKHHKHIAASSVLASLQQEKQQVIERLIFAFNEEHKALSARMVELQQQIETVRGEHSQLGKHDIQLSRLRRDIQAKQRLYEAFLARLQETEILKDLDSNEEFAVVDKAAIPKYPAKPRKVLLMGVVSLLSVICSVTLWLTLHLVSDRRTRYQQILQKLDVPVLAEVPKLGKKKLSKQKQGDTQDNALTESADGLIYSEAIRSLRTSVMVRSDRDQTRIIALAGIKHSEHIAELAISLSESFSKLEKALLVDTDLRNPAIAKAFALNTRHPGITNFIERKASFTSCLHRESGSNLTIMPSGPTPADPIVYLSKARFAGFIKKLGVFYERLILQAPPVNTYSDALIVSKLVDGVILVIDLESTESDELIEAIHRLREAGAPLLGVVLNRVKNIRSNLLPKSRSKRLINKAFGY